MHDAVWTCLRNLATQVRACGPALLDTGAFLLRIANAGLTEPWAKGAPMVMDFQNDGVSVVASMRMTAGGQAQDIGYSTLPTRGVILQPGVAAYYAYAVLYDPKRRVLGFKARPPVEGLPQAAPRP